MPADFPAEPFVVGATHRSSTATLRDRLFIDESAAPDFFQILAAAGIRQALVLSTCDRVEVQGMAPAPVVAIAAARAALARRAGLDPSEIAGQLEEFSGDAAARRIFAVAASLESQVIGESQVLGQVKAAHRLAGKYGMAGPELEGCLRAAYGAAKRVRSETPIAERPVTMASGAVQVARDMHGDLSGATGLLVGSGDMGDLIAGQLRLAGLERLALTGPSRRIEAEARRQGLHFVPFERLDEALVDADIVVTAAGTGRYLITPELMRAALKRRRRRPVLLIDGGVPGDVDPAVDKLDGAYIYTLDDLEGVAREGRANREGAAAAAWAIVESEVAAWRRNRAERDAVPAVMALRRQVEAIRDEILAADPKADAAEATRRLVNRLLHGPSAALRRLAAERGAGEAAEAEKIIAMLFGPEPAGTGGDENEEGE